MKGLCTVKIGDTDLKVRSMNALKSHSKFIVADIQVMGRNGFLGYSPFSYSVKLDIMNYLHKNAIYFYDDNEY